MGSGKSRLYSGTNGSFLESSLEENIKVLNKELALFVDNSSIEANAHAMAADYSLTESGKFGEKGKTYRVISSPDPITTSIDFYNKIGRGGRKTNLPNGKGTKTILGDGTIIVHRIVTSTKGSPAVEISVSGSPRIKNQKIHFILKEK